MSSMYPLVKRALDVAAATAGLIVLSPLLVGCAIAVKISSDGPALFRQQRVGRNGVPFVLLKFRTMVNGPGVHVTAACDPRITRIGRVLRKYKLDELPQLVNVARGDMSLVGPRPEVAKYVAKFEREYDRILRVRPGITDFAAIAYRHEEQLLAEDSDPEAAYVQRVLPAKIKLYEHYIEQCSLATDISLIVKTVGAILK